MRTVRFGFLPQQVAGLGHITLIECCLRLVAFGLKIGLPALQLQESGFQPCPRLRETHAELIETQARTTFHCPRWRLHLQ